MLRSIKSGAPQNHQSWLFENAPHSSIDISLSRSSTFTCFTLLLSSLSSLHSIIMRSSSSSYIPQSTSPFACIHNGRPTTFLIAVLLIFTVLFLTISQGSLRDGLIPIRVTSSSTQYHQGTFNGENAVKDDNERVDSTWNHILDNIGARAGAADGLVIASPSKSNPDYYGRIIITTPHHIAHNQSY